MPTYGDFNSSLTKAIKRLCRAGSETLHFTFHSEGQMEERGFDHGEVLECLRRGKAYGPEPVKGEMRASVVHRSLHIRVVVGNVGATAAEWDQLEKLTVITVMEAK